MKRFLFFAVVATLFAACSKDAISEEQGIQNIVDEAPETLTVGFEDDETRIQLNEDVKTVWTKGDIVSVFYKSNANQKWKYDGETGARTADLKCVDVGEATEQINRVVVLYPYNESYLFNTETFNVQITLPDEQTYLKDSYGLDGNIMISSDEFNQISLKSVYGWLKVQLTGAGEHIKSITVRGNNGEQMAGIVYIDSSDATTTLATAMGSAEDPEVGGAGGKLVFEDSIHNDVTLNCSYGVKLGAEATSFYIALPPQTFKNGISVDITAYNGSTMTKSTDKELIIERNHIKPMTAFVYAPTTPAIPKTANNEIWYTNGSTTKNTAPNKPKNFGGATIQSNLYDADKGCWVITFDKDVTQVGDSAFYERSGITSVTIPDSVTTIGYYAFNKCTSLTSVTIGDSVTTIGEWAFHNCYSLPSVNIPDSVTTIGEYAFYSCDSLTSVTIPDSVTTIGERAFGQCGLTSVNIPDSVTTIGSGAFSSCWSLTSVNIPNSVTTIGMNAFCDCWSLPSVTIPESVTTINSYAFRDCRSLTRITIPKNVTGIGYHAFYGCSSLRNVYCKPTTPPSGGEDMFEENSVVRAIYVPASDDDSIIKAYKAKLWWSDYADYIFEEEE